MHFFYQAIEFLSIPDAHNLQFAAFLIYLSLLGIPGGEETVQRQFFMCHFAFPQHSKTVRLIGYHLIKAFIINAWRGYGHLLTAA